jgi:hypothetical protein
MPISFSISCAIRRCPERPAASSGSEASCVLELAPGPSSFADAGAEAYVFTFG